MWWVPLATASALAVLLFGLHAWHQRKQVRDAKSYRTRFVQLVAQLETVTRTVNQLAEQVRGVKDAKLLDYYESTLRLLETLLAAIRKVPPFGADPDTLDSGFFLVRDCRQRIARTQQAFQDALKGREVRLNELYGNSGGAEPVKTTGCYFCSRPVIANRFAEVKVRIDGAVKEVMACTVCKEELEASKKVKVLYFMKDGKPVHWSEIADYTPTEDYWNINKRDVSTPKPRRLELVPALRESTEASMGDGPRKD